MKKLFFYEIKVRVSGYYYSLLKKEKYIKATTFLSGSLVCEEALKESSLVEIVEKYKENLNQKIKIRKHVNIEDESDPLFASKHFEKISDITMINYDIKEATVEQAIETLTVSDFVDVYGNVLKIER